MSMATTDPLVSIVVPSYNAATHLRTMLDSILGQSYRHTEVLLLDDASNDETPEIAASYAGRIRYHRQPVNRGQFRNAEDGIALARGKYIAVYHADDVYDPEIVAREVEFLEAHPDVGVVFCLSRFADGAGREYGRLALPSTLAGLCSLDYEEVLNGVLLYKNVFMPTPGAMGRAALYRQIGGYSAEFGSAADLAMWLRFARLSRVGLLHKHLFTYRHTSNSEGQSYQIGRTSQENYFAVMEREIAEHGAAKVTPASRRAFEAHRAVDALRICVNAYIAGEVGGAGAAWRQISVADLLRSGQVQRPRHLVLWGALGILTRLPHVRGVAAALRWRYYERLPWWQAP